MIADNSNLVYMFFRSLSAFSTFAKFAFRGAIAQQIVKDIREAGGTLSLKDLAEYKAIVRKPLEAEIKGLTMLSNPPPGSGALISLALKIMEGIQVIFFLCYSIQILGRAWTQSRLKLSVAFFEMTF